MTNCLLYMAPIALIGLMATEAAAVPAVWSGSMARNDAAAMADANARRWCSCAEAVIAAVPPQGVSTAAVPPDEVPGPVPVPVSTAGTLTVQTSTGTSTSTEMSMSVVAAITVRAGVALPPVSRPVP